MRKLIFTIALFLVFSSLISARWLSYRDDGTVDITIVAVVEQKPILSSELDQVVMSSGITPPEDSVEFFKFYAQVLSQIINEQLILEAARAESVQVDDELVEAEFNARLDSLINRFGGEEVLAESLKAEGMNINQFRVQLRQQIKDGLMKQAYIQKHLGFIEVSDDEVKEFYELYKDSLPPLPRQLFIQAILIPPQDDSVCWKLARNDAYKAYELLKHGKPFKAVAESLSDDLNTRESGGYLGKFALEDIPKAFRTAVLNLGAGSFSKPLRGDRGYHIVRVLSRRGKKVELAHIFFERPSPEAAAMRIAMAVYDSARSGVEFTELVKKYSADSASAAKNGNVGWISEEALPKEMLAIIDSVGEGTVLPPVPERNGVAIYRIKTISPPRKLSLEKDMDILRRFAKQWKMNKRLEAIIDELKEKFYVEIRDKRLEPFLK